MNINKISTQIIYNKFYEIMPELKQYSGKNLFYTYLLSDDDFILTMIYIGKKNNIHYFIPLSIEEFNNFIIWGKRIEYKNNILILDNIITLDTKNCLISSTNLTNKYIKKTNKYINEFETECFIKTLIGLNE